MKKRFVLFILVFAVIAVSIAYAHEEVQDFGTNQIYPVSQLQAVGYGSLAFIIISCVMLFFNSKMDEMAKKLVYSLLLIVVVLVSVYLAVTTIHTNLASSTKGPVHWHADYEIWVCGQKLSLPEPKGISNEQGTDLMHSHNDNRIHVEGALADKRQASLGAFFQAVGGYLSDDEIKVPTDEGLITSHNGDLCGGQPAKLYVFVNGSIVNDPAYYVIAPYGAVPPGDKIKFIFTEKQMQDINPNIG